MKPVWARATLLGLLGFEASASARQAQTRSGIDCLPWGKAGARVAVQQLWRRRR